MTIRLPCRAGISLPRTIDASRRSNRGRAQVIDLDQKCRPAEAALFTAGTITESVPCAARCLASSPVGHQRSTARTGSGVSENRRFRWVSGRRLRRLPWCRHRGWRGAGLGWRGGALGWRGAGGWAGVAPGWAGVAAGVGAPPRSGWVSGRAWRRAAINTPTATILTTMATWRRSAIRPYAHNRFLAVVAQWRRFMNASLAVIGSSDLAAVALPEACATRIKTVECLPVQQALRQPRASS
jgi:hypothetical protein